MADEFFSRGISPEEIEVKLFGGGSIIGPQQNNRFSVGNQNVQSALNIIKELGLKVTVNETGKNIGRKLYFLTGTGDIYLKPLNNFNFRFSKG